MAHYVVRFTLRPNNTHVYPKSVEGVVWKSIVYHYTKYVMIGETDAKVKADGKRVRALTPDQAKKLMEEYQSSYPEPQGLPEPLRIALEKHLNTKSA